MKTKWPSYSREASESWCNLEQKGSQMSTGSADK